jgi:tripartite-type tricarboxylate transporter receptor subunit TctC
MIVPFAAGGGTDVLARSLAEHMRTTLGQPVIIENVPGAGGSIGVGRVARALPDGHTIGLGQNGTYVLNGAIYVLQYDLTNDFDAVALISTAPHLFVARKTLPANELKGLVAWLKANPDKAAQGIPGAGSMGHLSGLLFQKETGTRFVFVPYRGAAPMLQDLAAGHIDFTILDPASSLPLVRNDAIKALAVLANRRFAAAPDIPGADEAGFPRLHSASWYGLWMPKGGSWQVITRLNTAITAALADPNVRRRLADLGQEIFPREQQTFEALAALQKAEIEKWWPIIKAANIKAE